MVASISNGLFSRGENPMNPHFTPSGWLPLQWYAIASNCMVSCHFNDMLLHHIASYYIKLYGVALARGKVGMNGITVRRMRFARYLWARLTPYSSPFPHVSYNSHIPCWETLKTHWRKTKTCNQTKITMHPIWADIRWYKFWLLDCLFLPTINALTIKSRS